MTFSEQRGFLVTGLTAVGRADIAAEVAAGDMVPDELVYLSGELRAAHPTLSRQLRDCALAFVRERERGGFATKFKRCS